MHQNALWPDTIYDALGAAADAAGGKKRAANKMWPTLSADIAAARLRGSLNVDHAQKLDPDEFVALMRLGKEHGNHSVMEWLARDLGYEVKPLSPVEAKKRAKRVRRLALLDELKRLEDEE
jgi:hypothetical protein